MQVKSSIELYECDIILPDHSKELQKAGELISIIKTRLNGLKALNNITVNQHEQLFEKTLKILDYVGQLSLPVFLLEDKLEALYISRYPNTPELAKTMWLDHYDTLHHPYSILKNRCFRLLEELDALYLNVHGVNPPNYCPSIEYNF
jgi:hypothetical protein